MDLFPLILNLVIIKEFTFYILTDCDVRKRKILKIKLIFQNVHIMYFNKETVCVFVSSYWFKIHTMLGQSLHQ